MKNIYRVMAIASIFCLFSSTGHAAAKKRWVSNPGLNTPDYYQPPPGRPMPPPHGHPVYPSYPGHPPYPPRPPHRPPPPPQHGVSIYYQAPQTVQYQSNQTTWINGQPVSQQSSNSTEIYSSSYQVITNWRSVGLPAPPQGMYWIYDQGRYMLKNTKQ